MQEVINYIHMSYESTYESKLHIVIKDGIVQGKKTIDNRKKK